MNFILFFLFFPLTLFPLNGQRNTQKTELEQLSYQLLLESSEWYDSVNNIFFGPTKSPQQREGSTQQRYNLCIGEYSTTFPCLIRKRDILFLTPDNETGIIAIFHDQKRGIWVVKKGENSEKTKKLEVQLIHIVYGDIIKFSCTEDQQDHYCIEASTEIDDFKDFIPKRGKISNESRFSEKKLNDSFSPISLISAAILKRTPLTQEELTASFEQENIPSKFIEFLKQYSIRLINAEKPLLYDNESEFINKDMKNNPYCKNISAITNLIKPDKKKSFLSSLYNRLDKNIANMPIDENILHNKDNIKLLMANIHSQFKDRVSIQEISWLENLIIKQNNQELPNENVTFISIIIAALEKAFDSITNADLTCSVSISTQYIDNIKAADDLINKIKQELSSFKQPACPINIIIKDNINQDTFELELETEKKVIRTIKFFPTFVRKNTVSIFFNKTTWIHIVAIFLLITIIKQILRSPENQFQHFDLQWNHFIPTLFDEALMVLIGTFFFEDKLGNIKKTIFQYMFKYLMFSKFYSSKIMALHKFTKKPIFSFIQSSNLLSRIQKIFQINNPLDLLFENMHTIDQYGHQAISMPIPSIDQQIENIDSAYTQNIYIQVPCQEGEQLRFIELVKLPPSATKFYQLKNGIIARFCINLATSQIGFFYLYFVKYCQNNQPLSKITSLFFRIFIMGIPFILKRISELFKSPVTIETHQKLYGAYIQMGNVYPFPTIGEFQNSQLHALLNKQKSYNSFDAIYANVIQQGTKQNVVSEESPSQKNIVQPPIHNVSIDQQIIPIIQTTAQSTIVSDTMQVQLLPTDKPIPTILIKDDHATLSHEHKENSTSASDVPKLTTKIHTESTHNNNSPENIVTQPIEPEKNINQTVSTNLVNDNSVDHCTPSSSSPKDEQTPKIDRLQSTEPHQHNFNATPIQPNSNNTLPSYVPKICLSKMGSPLIKFIQNIIKDILATTSNPEKIRIIAKRAKNYSYLLDITYMIIKKFREKGLDINAKDLKRIIKNSILMEEQKPLHASL